MNDIKLKVNAKGLTCPLPVLRAKNALKDIDVGELIEVISTEAQSVDDFAVYCEQSGHKMVDSLIREYSEDEDENEQTEYVFIIRKV